MKKTIKIIIAVVIITALGFVLWMATGFYGNPISKVLANNNVDKYIEDNYKELNLDKEKCVYNFKFNDYFVRVQSKDSIDTGFDIHFDSKGNVLRDDYEYIGDNTRRRLDDEIHKEVQNILRKKFPAQNNKINACMIDASKDENLPFDMSLDMPLDIKNTPYPLEVTMQVFSDEKTYQNVAKIMTEAQEILQKEDIEVAKYDIVIIPLKDKVEDFRGVSWADAITVMDIPVELLSEDNPAEAIEYYDEHQYDENDSVSDIRKIESTSLFEISRIYTSEEKINIIYDYLNNLSLKDEFPENPDEYEGNTYTITLTYNNYKKDVYYHFGNIFLKKNDENWERMTYDEAIKLDTIIQSNPSD